MARINDLTALGPKVLDGQTARHVDRGLLEPPTGQGYCRYRNPAFQGKDLLAVPGASRVPEPLPLARPTE